MADLSELRQQLEAYTKELHRLREDIEPAEWKQHERLQTVRAERRALAKRIERLNEEQRAARPEVDEYADYRRAVDSGGRKPDPKVMQRLVAAVREAAPTTGDDPRLGGWYHTIDLGDGLRSRGGFDLRATVDLHGFPDSLKGKTALDVGTCDGFWAFEMERRGADRVVAMDVERFGDVDWLPRVRGSMPQRAIDRRMDHGFWLAHAMRGSRVEHKICSVYDLSPDTVGTFDVVFCGSLLMHLQNPLKALVNICSVTREKAIIATLLSKEIEQTMPDKPWIQFGQRGPDLDPEVHRQHPQLGASVVYWHVNTTALQELMEYAGFDRTEPLDPVPLAPSGNSLAVVTGYPAPR